MSIEQSPSEGTPEAPQKKLNKLQRAFEHGDIQTLQGTSLDKLMMTMASKPGAPLHKLYLHRKKRQAERMRKHDEERAASIQRKSDARIERTANVPFGETYDGMIFNENRYGIDD